MAYAHRIEPWSWLQLSTLATLKEFAAMTGGRAFYNSNDLAEGFKQAAEDSTSYYMLGYSNTTSGSLIAMHPSGPWPKISVVTPVFNSARYLEAAIRSVLSQAYPKLEYIIVDGGSTDGSLAIVSKYAPQLHAWISEPDRGMYDALNKGFARSAGELIGWISATDMLHAGSLSVVGSVFQTFPEVEWITGRPTGFSDEVACRSRRLVEHRA